MLSEWFVFVVVKGEHCVRVVWFGVVFGVKEEDFEAVRISGFEGGLHIGVLLPVFCCALWDKCGYDLQCE